MLSISGLGFLGFGVQPPTAEIGLIMDRHVPFQEAADLQEALEGKIPRGHDGQRIGPERLPITGPLQDLRVGELRGLLEYPRLLRQGAELAVQGTGRHVHSDMEVVLRLLPELRPRERIGRLHEGGDLPRPERKGEERDRLIALQPLAVGPPTQDFSDGGSKVPAHVERPACRGVKNTASAICLISEAGDK